MRGALSRYPISATWIAATALAVLIVYLIPTGANGTQPPTTETVFVPAPDQPDRPPPPDDPPAKPKGQNKQQDGPSSPTVDGNSDGPVIVGLPSVPPPALPPRPPVRPGPPKPAPVKPHPPKGKKAGWQDDFKAKMGEWRCSKQPKAC